MYYQLTRLSVAEIQQNGYSSQYSGSSKFKSYQGMIFEKEEKEKPTVIEKLEKEAMQTVEKEKVKRYYKLRKNKIRNKILNFFSLNASKKFCAFYSISFPRDINDDLAYKIFNVWLTRCRKSAGLKSYLWVAERQKNNTLHFHLITNNFIPIRLVNDYMRITLLNEYDKGNLVYKREKLEKYNGIDVDNLYKSKRNKNKNKRLNKVESQRKLSYYLTKYISKNNTTSERLPWHCSRDISALFISIHYADFNTHEIADIISNNPEAVHSIYEDYFTIHYFKFQPLEEWFENLTEINNLVYEKMNPN